jgi:hypothetical protein
MADRRFKFRLYDYGPVLSNTLEERAPGEPPNIEWRYQVHRWIWEGETLVEEPEGEPHSWMYLDGEWEFWDPANIEREKLEAEWRATFVDGYPPVVEQVTVERNWKCPKCEGDLTANPPKWTGELRITCGNTVEATGEVCGQVQYVASTEVAIDKPIAINNRMKQGRR